MSIVINELDSVNVFLGVDTTPCRTFMSLTRDLLITCLQLSPSK